MFEIDATSINIVKPYPYKYIFVVTGYNCDRWIDKCVSSIINQSLSIWHCVLCDDASTDETWQRISKWKSDDRFTLVRNLTNHGACHMRWKAIETLKSRNAIDNEDVILLIGGDDWLSGPDVVKIVDRKYKAGAEMTYGNWQDLKTGRINPLRYFPKTISKRRAYRKHPLWVATAINTFQYQIFKRIDPDIYFKDENGNWIKNCTDLAVMFPALELTHPSKIIPIKDVLYIYNSSYSHNTKSRFGRKHKNKLDSYIRRMPPAHKTSNYKQNEIKQNVETLKIKQNEIKQNVETLKIKQNVENKQNVETLKIKQNETFKKVKKKQKDKKNKKQNKVDSSSKLAKKPLLNKSMKRKYIVFRTKGGSTIRIELAN